MSKIEELLSALENLTSFNDGDDEITGQAARILRAAHAAGFVTDQGEVRKVLGTLAVTADGCILGVESTAYAWFSEQVWEVELPRHIWRKNEPRTVSWHAGSCYSTKAAAEAGRESK